MFSYFFTICPCLLSRVLWNKLSNMLRVDSKSVQSEILPGQTSRVNDATLQVEKKWIQSHHFSLCRLKGFHPFESLGYTAQIPQGAGSMGVSYRQRQFWPGKWNLTFTSNHIPYQMAAFDICHRSISLYHSFSLWGKPCKDDCIAAFHQDPHFVACIPLESRCASSFLRASLACCHWKDHNKELWFTQSMGLMILKYFDSFLFFPISSRIDEITKLSCGKKNASLSHSKMTLETHILQKLTGMYLDLLLPLPWEQDTKGHRGTVELWKLQAFHIQMEVS